MSSRQRSFFLILSVLILGTSAAVAHEIDVAPVECLPNETNISLSASVAPEIDGSEQMRLYFRRLNRTGAYYWVKLNPTGAGDYWGVFPKPEDRNHQELDDEWWEILKERDWMEGRDREWLEDYFDEQEHEAAEYYLAVTDVAGNEVSRTKTLLVPVRDRDDCRFGLDSFELGQSRNLTVGETTELQEGKEVFHWLCDGVISRVNTEGVLRGDEACRACVIAAWLPLSSTAGAVVAGTTFQGREPRRASDILPQP